MSLANVVSMAAAAQSLRAPRRSAAARPAAPGHPPAGRGPFGARTCARARPTIPPDRGLFLETTWRLHPALARFTSEVFYDDRLESEAHLSVQRLTGDELGRRWPAPGPRRRARGSTASTRRPRPWPRSSRDAARTGAGSTRTGPSAISPAADVLIVAPYNAQVGAIKRLLPDEARVGTVDKFQGQEAPISIYSMTTSHRRCAPRDGLPVQPEPPERGDLAGPLRGGGGRIARCSCGAGADARPDATRQRVVPVCRAGRRSASADDAADAERRPRCAPDARAGVAEARRAAAYHRRQCPSPVAVPRGAPPAHDLDARRRGGDRQHRPHRGRHRRHDRGRRARRHGRPGRAAGCVRRARLGTGLGAAVDPDGPPRSARRAVARLHDQRRRRDRRDQRGDHRVAADPRPRHAVDRVRQQFQPAVAVRRRRPRAARTAGVDARARRLGSHRRRGRRPNLVAFSGEVAENLGLPVLTGPYLVPMVFVGAAAVLSFVMLRPDPYELADTTVEQMRGDDGAVTPPCGAPATPGRPRSDHGTGLRPGGDGPDHDDDPAAHDAARPRPRGGRVRDQRPHLRDVRAVADLGTADRPLWQPGRHRGGPRGPRDLLGPRRGRSAGGRRAPVHRAVPARLRLEHGLRRRIRVADARPGDPRTHPVSGLHGRLHLELGGRGKPVVRSRGRLGGLRDAGSHRGGPHRHPGDRPPRHAGQSGALPAPTG